MLSLYKIHLLEHNPIVHRTVHSYESYAIHFNVKYRINRFYNLVNFCKTLY